MFLQQFYIIANILMIVDGLIVIVSGYAAYSISLELASGMVMAWNDFLGSVLFMMFANNFVMGRFRLYSQTRFRSYLTMINSLIIVTSIDILMLSTGAMMIGIRPFSRVFAMAYFLIALILFLITRVALHIYLDRRSLTASNSREILLVGTLERVKPVLDALRKQRTWGHQTGLPRPGTFRAEKSGTEQQKNKVRLFIDSVRNGSTLIPIDEILSTTQVTFGIIESIRTGQVVRV